MGLQLFEGNKAEDSEAFVVEARESKKSRKGEKKGFTRRKDGFSKKKGGI